MFAFCVSFIWFWVSPSLKTGILDLIPQTEKTLVTRAAYEALTTELENQVVILVEAEEIDNAINAADFLAAKLSASKTQVATVTCRIDESVQKQFFDVFFSARWSVLSKENRELARHNKFEAFARKATQRLYSLVSGVPSSLLKKDPFYLFEDLALSMPRYSGDFALEEEHLVLHKNDKTFVLLSALGATSVFGGSGANKLTSLIERGIQDTSQKYKNINIHWTGMAKYADHAASSAQKEVSIIGTGSLIGVVLLLLLAFSSFRELVFGLVPIGVGIVSALVTTVWIFGEIHVITLVFGASLVGVCIDYSFHYFSHNLQGGKAPSAVLSEVFPGITLGMATSVIGYSALLVAPFPGLQQMAVFAGVGLIGAYATVVFWFPLFPFSTKSRKRPWGWNLVGRYVNGIQKKHLWVAVGVCLPFAAAIFGLGTNDDIRLLRGETADLEKEEQFISNTIDTFDKSRFIVVQAATEEKLAQKEETLIELLYSAKNKKIIGDFAAVAMLVPSKKVQQENRRFMKSFVDSPQGAAYFNTLGWTDDDKRRILSDIEKSTPLDFASVEKKTFAALHSKLRLGKVNNEWASVVLLKGVARGDSVSEMIRPVSGVTYIDKVETVTSLFTEYRRISTGLVAGAYVFIFVFLAIRYGWKKGMGIILPPLITALVLLGTMSFLNVDANVFTFWALLIVLAIGIDYTLFFAESNEIAPTGFAILLSGVTTILSFGLLALSQNPGLRIFGATVLLGIFLAVLLSPLSRVVYDKAE